MRALVTGIRGAAGSYLAEHLISLGHEVWGIARPDCDLEDFRAVRRRLEEARPDVIFHLASKADVRRSFDEPARVFRNNTAGTLNLLEAVRLLDPPPVVVLCSSSEVYGDPDRSPITEEFPIARQTNPYAVSKAAQDLLGQMYAASYGLRIVITRAFGYVNPRRIDLSLSSFARQIVAIERGEARELVHGNLESARTFCDVRDVVEAYALAAELPGVRRGDPISGIYNIGAEEPVTIRACLEMMIEMSSVPIPTRVDPARLRPLDVRAQIPDCSRFRAATCWRPRRRLRESLAWLLYECRSEIPAPRVISA